MWTQVGLRNEVIARLDNFTYNQLVIEFMYECTDLFSTTST